ncbi:MAG: TMEM165/GDT1 family protein [Planctomycetes bacterium]|nr:TMEM165/GDT1 family protein [Planctomycetota bacterium]MBM4082275.1 TMEM165/GDT1 family protein [Planctomycetota bacterium]
MDWKVFLTAFNMIFLAELGDKTQLAAISLTCESDRPLAVFLGTVFALAVVTAFGVLFGEMITHVMPKHVMRAVAALAFIVIGVLMLLGKM